MKGLYVLVLLLSAVLLCRAVPPLQALICGEDHIAAAARLALHDINEHHDKGYKFQLREITANKTEMVGSGCTTELELDLLETTSHTVSPVHFEDCEPRKLTERAVMANCSVEISVTPDETLVKSYNCDTRQAKVPMCPDCPVLLPLNNLPGLNSISKAIEGINRNRTHERYYVLKEVGRILSGLIPSQGMFYSTEFVIVETHCRMGTRIRPEACTPLCPNRARHATCHSFYSNAMELQPLECEYIAAQNTTVLGQGEKEPVCDAVRVPLPILPLGPGPVILDLDQDRQGPPPHAHDKDRRGPPPHAHDQDRRGPPPHAHDQDRQGPPPHAHDEDRQGPPPHAHDEDRQGPPPHAQGHSPPCNGFLLNSDPTLHPICPKPLPEPKGEH